MVATKLIGLDEEIIKQYKSGVDGVTLSRKYNVSRSVIYQLLRRNKEEVRTKAVAKRIYSFNESFFDIIDNEENAYVLGLLYADGYNDQKNERVRLGSCDLDMIEAVAKAIKSNHPFQTINKGRGKGGFEITIHSKHMCEMLASKGCMQAKTFILKFPDLTIVPVGLLRHFIRGYFDGDGCITMHGKWNQKSVTFLGTLEFLISLKEIIPVKCCPTITKLRGCYSLQISNQTEVKKLGEWIYTDATIYLERKKRRFDDCYQYQKYA